jgi:hypothetical protein
MSFSGIIYPFAQHIPLIYYHYLMSLLPQILKHEQKFKTKFPVFYFIFLWEYFVDDIIQEPHRFSEFDFLDLIHDIIKQHKNLFNQKNHQLNR